MSDLIDRQAALDALSVYIHLVDKTMGKGILTDDDCMEAAKSVLGEDEIPAAQPDHNADIDKKVEAEDCISRKAAIDALKGLPTWWADEGGYYGGAQPPTVALLDPEDAVSAIENLPSAQPATSCSEIPNSSDSISRQVAIEAMGKAKWAKERLEDLPSAQPEIIRCKDCKYWRDDHTCHEHSLVSPMCANEYCSRAERKNDGQSKSD